MFSGQGSVVVGYRWITFGGENACKQCAALNGREYYLNPGPGQASISDMPHPPLHPNCGCKLMEIIDVSNALTDQATTLPADQEPRGDHRVGAGPQEVDGKALFKDRLLKLHWRKEDILSGPVYGNFCGEFWSKGRDTRSGKNHSHEDEYPKDDLDAACQAHDFGYDHLDESETDTNLVKHLEGLSEDPSMWLNPPDPSRVEEAKRYRKLAIFWFKLKIRRDKDRREMEDSARHGLVVSP
ncbi:MAG: hypothetical protein KKC78_11490 [Proteobacteria bacterium]|nr:hypothetical protein [Pseudomonadota bacterium]